MDGTDSMGHGLVDPVLAVLRVKLAGKFRLPLREIISSDRELEQVAKLSSRRYYASTSLQVERAQCLWRQYLPLPFRYLPSLLQCCVHALRVGKVTSQRAQHVRNAGGVPVFDAPALSR